jgi:hypothetical protein
MATTVGHLSAQRTSSTWPTWSVLPRSARSIESSTSIQAGNGLPDSRPDAPSGCSAWLSAHTHVVRLIIVAMNLMLCPQRKPVRTFLSSGDAIERIARENGLTPHVAHHVGLAWQVAVFHRE